MGLIFAGIQHFQHFLEIKIFAEGFAKINPREILENWLYCEIRIA